MISLLVYVQAILERDERIPKAQKEDYMNAIKQEFERFRQGLRQEGELKGKAKGKAEAVIQVLKARGFVLSEEVRQHILRSKDSGTLDRWLERAVHAATIEEVLQTPG